LNVVLTAHWIETASVANISQKKRGDGHYFASEDSALRLFVDEIRDVRPGEAFLISDDIENKVLVKERHHHCVFEYIYFARPDSVLDDVSVYKARVRMGMELAIESPADVDVVIPVPDSGRAAALGFSQISGIPYAEGLIKNRYIGRTFIMPGQFYRELKVKLKLSPVREVIDGKRVVLIDDSIVRGTTSRSPSLSKLMREPKIMINEEDAKKLNIVDNDFVEIETKRGKIRMKVKTGKVPKGLLVVPFHSKVNKITNNALNKAGTPEFKFSAARIKKVQKSKAHSG